MFFIGGRAGLRWALGSAGNRLEKAEDFFLCRLLTLVGLGIMLLEGQGGSFLRRCSQAAEGRGASGASGDDSSQTANPASRERLVLGVFSTTQDEAGSFLPGRAMGQAGKSPNGNALVDSGVFP